MNWENIGKLSFAIICGFAVAGILYLIIRIVSWKWNVDSKIELQDEVNKELFQAFKDIKTAIDEAISEEGSDDESIR